MYVIQIHSNAYSSNDHEFDNSFLQSFDCEAHEGRGAAVMTQDVKLAIHFKTHIEAGEFWKQQSKTRPFREDGKPNRPLTSFSVSIVHKGGKDQ